MGKDHVFPDLFLFIYLSIVFMNVLSLMALQDKPWYLSKARKHAQHSALREWNSCEFSLVITLWYELTNWKFQIIHML